MNYVPSILLVLVSPVVLLAFIFFARKRRWFDDI